MVVNDAIPNGLPAGIIEHHLYPRSLEVFHSVNSKSQLAKLKFEAISPKAIGGRGHLFLPVTRNLSVP